jgi:hypothetical protein
MSVPTTLKENVQSSPWTLPNAAAMEKAGEMGERAL